MHLSVQEINGCDTFQLGDKFAIFSLTITEFTEDTLGEYAVTFTNVAGSVSVPATRVTDRGRHNNMYFMSNSGNCAVSCT